MWNVTNGIYWNWPRLRSHWRRKLHFTATSQVLASSLTGRFASSHSSFERRICNPPFLPQRGLKTRSLLWSSSHYGKWRLLKRDGAMCEKATIAQKSALSRAKSESEGHSIWSHRIIFILKPFSDPCSLCESICISTFSFFFIIFFFNLSSHLFIFMSNGANHCIYLFWFYFFLHCIAPLGHWCSWTVILNKTALKASASAKFTKWRFLIVCQWTMSENQ